MNEEYMLAKMDEFLKMATPEYILQKCAEYGCKLEPAGIFAKENFDVAKAVKCKGQNDAIFPNAGENQYAFAA